MYIIYAYVNTYIYIYYTSVLKDVNLQVAKAPLGDLSIPNI